MNILNYINALVIIIGLPSLVAACVYIGRKLQILENLDNGFKALREDFDEEHEQVILMRAKLFGFSASPMKPNEPGAKLLQESGFSELYPKIKGQVFAAIMASGARTLYDVEKKAMRALRTLDNDPLFDPLKTYAINHPEDSLELVYLVASWVIRDDYASAHPEIK